MIREKLMEGDLGRTGDFRWRGHEVSRIEGLSDAEETERKAIRRGGVHPRHYLSWAYEQEVQSSTFRLRLCGTDKLKLEL